MTAKAKFTAIKSDTANCNALNWPNVTLNNKSRHLQWEWIYLILLKSHIITCQAAQISKQAHESLT